MGEGVSVYRCRHHARPSPSTSSHLHSQRMPTQVFNRTGVEAALAAGIFHRREVEISAVKAHLKEVGIPVRIVPPPGQQPAL